MKPIQSAFRAACALTRLANEWRDTTFYTLLTLNAGMDWMQGNHGHAAQIFLFTAGCREIVRAAGWSMYSAPRLVGDDDRPVEHGKHTIAAIFTAYSLAAAYCGFSHLKVADAAILMPDNFILWGGVAGAGLFVVNKVGWDEGVSISDIPRRYFGEMGMWDWPRNGDGNGPTQTQKFRDGAASFGRWLTAAIPRPALGASRAVLAMMPR